MRLLASTTEEAPLHAVTPHPRNPRHGDVGAIHTSIEKNGFYGVIIAQRSTGHILVGNHRYQAAKAAGAETIPVQWIDVDDDHALRILLADNRTNDVATYDDQALADLLTSLRTDTGDLTGTGYDGDDLDDLLQHLDEPFHPNLNPNLDLNDATDDDVQKAEERMQEKFSENRKTFLVMCPACGEEFYID